MLRDEAYRGVWPGMPPALAASSSCQPACPGPEAALHVLHMTLLRDDTDNEEVTVGNPVFCSAVPLLWRAGQRGGLWKLDRGG